LARNLRQTLGLENLKGAAMPGSYAEEIVVDFIESDDWAVLTEDEAEPELDLPPLPPPTPRPSAR
jgi:hypothetical protein